MVVTDASKAEAGRPAYVYIVECADGTLYTGWCYDVASRIATHNAGKGAKYTRARLPVVLRWQETHPDQSAARRREIELKRLPRKTKLLLVRIVKDGSARVE